MRKRSGSLVVLLAVMTAVLPFGRPSEAASVRFEKAASVGQLYRYAAVPQEAPLSPVADLSRIAADAQPVEGLGCYLDYILALENFMQATVFLVYYAQDPSNLLNLTAAYLTYVVAFSRYFDYLECLIEE